MKTQQTVLRSQIIVGSVVNESGNFRQSQLFTCTRASFRALLDAKVGCAGLAGEHLEMEHGADALSLGWVADLVIVHTACCQACCRHLQSQQKTYLVSRTASDKCCVHV